MTGDGELKGSLEEEVERQGLSDVVSFTGTISPKAVRDEMESAHIFLFTSNYLEGWGAVLNEAMGAGCGVIASAEAGATPFLIDDGMNGLAYGNGSYEDFAAKAGRMVSDAGFRQQCGKHAFDTIRDMWNAKEAAARLTVFVNALLEGKELPAYDKGPLSKAEVLKAPGFLRTRQEINHLQ